MYENDYMYAIERSPEYLAHYGIRGMKWGVRKAREMGGARGARRLSRQYAKASKKLAKLEKRAASGSKYARRAAMLGAGAGIAGGAALAGTSGIGKLMGGAGRLGKKIFPGTTALAKTAGLSGTDLKVAQNANRFISGKNAAIQRSMPGLTKAGEDLRRWGNTKSLSVDAANKLSNLQNKAYVKTAGLSGTDLKVAQNANRMITQNNAANAFKNKTTALTKGPTNNAIVRVAAGALGAGLAGAAGYNAYRAATTKRAARKAAQFRSEMNKAFAGTQYASRPRQGKKRRR